VNGIIQPDYGPSIAYSFGEAGIYTFGVIVYNPCGISSPQFLEVTAQGTAPATPSPIQGPVESCEGETEIYTTTVGPGEICSWWIDEELQASDSTTLEVTWYEQGDHIIEVRAVTECGTGNPTYKDVLVFYLPFVFLGNDTSILQGQILVLDAGNPGSDYLWSTGETTQTLEITLAGTYAVNVSNLCGMDNDIIEVSVITGIKEIHNPKGCLNVSPENGTLHFNSLPENTTNLQVFCISGRVLYNGPPVGRIKVSQPGIYLIRIITPETTCHKKVFVP